MKLNTMAQTIREHLKVAGVTRARLFTAGKNTMVFGTHGFQQGRARAAAPGRSRMAKVGQQVGQMEKQTPPSFGPAALLTVRIVWRRGWDSNPR